MESRSGSEAARGLLTSSSRGPTPGSLLGAFTGSPIYGDREIHGKKIAAAKLDRCNGLTSATPEFPSAVYHYVLLNVATSRSSIRCFTGKVSASLLASMKGMPGMGGGPPPNET